MKTLIVRYEDRVRFLITGHPDYRFGKLQEQMPVQIHLFGVTDVLVKDICVRFANQSLGDTLWYRLTDQMEEYLAGIIQK